MVSQVCLSSKLIVPESDIQYLKASQTSKGKLVT
jgi:hypothetical protein